MAVVALGVGARLLPWADVFPGGGVVNLLPADSHYYARFAHLQRAAFPRWVDEDRYVNFPSGALILWPPLHTASVAVAEALAGPAGDEAGVAWVGVGWSTLWLLGLCLVWWRAPLPHAGAALLLLAVAPICVQAGALGNGDHHVHEVFGAALGVHWLRRFLEAPTRARAARLGLLVGTARLFTTVGVLAGPLVALALVAALLSGVRPGARRLLEVGAWAVGPATLVVLAFGRLTLDYETVSLFGPASLVAAFSAPLAVAGVVEGTRWRWAAGVTLGLGAALGGQVLRGLGQLGTRDPLLGRVYESHPLWHPAVDAVGLLHALLFVGPLVVLGLSVQVRARRPLVAVLLVTVLLLAMGAQQIRFFQAASGALAGALGPALDGALALPRRSRRLAWGVVGVLLLSMLGTLEPATPQQTLATRCRPTMEWLRAHSPSPGAPFDSTATPRYGVLAGALLGHFIELWAERPAVACTFSQTTWHLAANAQASAVLSSEDEEAAWQQAKALRLAYVVLLPEQQVLGVPEAQWPRALARRLYEADGGPHFPLVYTSQELDTQGRPQLKVFAVEGVLEP
jgi:dolichyl-diphosphooligosaccharide--protein glycosyltransferase